MRRRERSECISEAEVKQLLMEADDSAERKRLILIIEYLNGRGVNQLSEQYNIEETTIQYWIDRFAYDTPENAVSSQEPVARKRCRH